MGADMIMSMIAHREGVKPSLELALRYIDSLRQEDLERTDGEFAYDEIDLDIPEALEEVKDLLRNTIEGVMANLDARDVSTWVMCGWICHFTGGMSMGDDPTDTFGDFNRMWSCGRLGTEVLEAAGFAWPPTGPDTFHINEEASPTDV